MTDFSDARIAKCPWCQTPFCVEEGPWCHCLQIMQETEEELEYRRRWEEENG